MVLKAVDVVFAKNEQELVEKGIHKEVFKDGLHDVATTAIVCIQLKHVHSDSDIVEQSGLDDHKVPNIY